MSRFPRLDILPDVSRHSFVLYGDTAGCIAYSTESELSSPGGSMISPSMSRMIMRALAGADGSPPTSSRSVRGIARQLRNVAIVDRQ
jgi:hypothetical protein